MSTWAKSNNDSYVNLDRADVISVSGSGMEGGLWCIMALVNGGEWFLGSYKTRNDAQAALDELMKRVGGTSK